MKENEHVAASGMSENFGRGGAKPYGHLGGLRKNFVFRMSDIASGAFLLGWGY